MKTGHRRGRHGLIEYLLIVAGVGILSGLTAASVEAQKQQEVPQAKIKIGTPGPSLSYLPIQVALEKGLFKKRGIDIEYSQFVPQISVAAVLNREVDYTTMPTPAATAVGKGAALKVIALISLLQHSLIAQPNIASPTDLIGKKIGIFRLGDITAFEAQFIVDKFHLGPQTALLSLGLAEQVLAAMKAKAVDAAIITSPQDIVAEDMGFRRLLNMGQLLQVPLGGVVASNEKIKNRPEEVLQVLKAMIEGLEFNKSHREEVIPIISKWVNLTPVQASRAYDAVKDTFSSYGVFSQEQTNNLLVILKATAGLREDITPSAIFDFSLVEQAAKELKVKK